jgi:hypothetical protein
VRHAPSPRRRSHRTKQQNARLIHGPLQRHRLAGSRYIAKRLLIQNRIRSTKGISHNRKLSVSSLPQAKAKLCIAKRATLIARHSAYLNSTPCCPPFPFCTVEYQGRYSIRHNLSYVLFRTVSDRQWARNYSHRCIQRIRYEAHYVGAPDERCSQSVRADVAAASRAKQ